MADFLIEQALYRRVRTDPPILLGRSSGFRAEWLPLAEQMLLDFGDRPPGTPCSSAVFAQPLGRRHVVIVQVADQDILQNGYSDTLGFRLLVLPRKEYTQFLGDPFVVAAKFPPNWPTSAPGADAAGCTPGANAAGLATLSWPRQPLPPRTVEQVRRVLQRTKSAALVEDQPLEEILSRPPEEEDSAGPVLLGGTQALVDGGRLVLERPRPDTELLRDLWMLLPTATRARLWPASFAFSTALHFDVVVVPRLNPDDYPGYTNEEQAADYPEGPYELNLQIAAEQGDQQSLDLLFGRQRPQEMFKLGLFLLGLILLMLLLPRLFERPQTSPERQQQARLISSIVTLHDPWLMVTSWRATQEELNALERKAHAAEERGQ